MSTPCTEGTGSFCRVPSRGFSRTPSDARLAHLCRIAVRADVSSTGGFSWPGEGELPEQAVALAGRGNLTPRLSICRRPPDINLHVGWRNINRLPIGYALGPRLRTRLTLGGLTFPRKPCAFGGWASHPSCRYSFRHAHSTALHGSLRSRFAAAVDALLPSRQAGSATAARRLSPRHFRRGMARPVSCYALLKWWLLLSQHPGCHRDPTSFATERRLGGLGRRSGLFPSRARSLSPAL